MMGSLPSLCVDPMALVVGVTNKQPNYMIKKRLLDVHGPETRNLRADLSFGLHVEGGARVVLLSANYSISLIARGFGSLGT